VALALSKDYLIKETAKRVNLVLRDVVIVKGFYINIVSEALFFKKGV
jgi:hypothetical protein